MAHLQVVPLVEFQFKSGTVRAALAPWDIVAGGQTYVGAGLIMKIANRTESTTSMEGWQITVSGLDASVAALAAGEPYQGRLAMLRKAYLDPDTNAVISVPAVVSVGRIARMHIAEDNKTATVRIEVEPFEAAWDRANPLFLNDADQQRLFPGDLGASHVNELATRKIVWPSKDLQLRSGR